MHYFLLRYSRGLLGNPLEYLFAERLLFFSVIHFVFFGLYKPADRCTVVLSVYL